MPSPKSLIFPFSAILILTAFTSSVVAIEYNPGVSVGQYVKYGNFVGSGPGVESFNDYDWSKLEVTAVSGKEVTLLTTGQFKNGEPIPGNGTTKVWNIETGTEDGEPSTQGPIIAANLTEGEAIPPPNTFSVNTTENRVYLGVSRSVNILEVTISTPDYTSSLTYVYDRLSGMLLESTVETVLAQPSQATSKYSYSVIETNIFSSSTAPLNTLIGFIILAITFLAIIVLLVVLVARRRKRETSR